MIKLKSLIEATVRDKYYYIQHLLDIDPNQATNKLIEDLTQNTEKWTKIYDPQLNGNKFEWHPSATLNMGEYSISVSPNIYREENAFIIFSVEISVSKKSFGMSKGKQISHSEEPLNITSFDGRDWDFSSLKAKLSNTVRQVKELLKKDI